MAKSTKDFKQHFEKIKGSVQNGLTSLQQVVQFQHTSSFYPSTLELQDSVKCGWLKKTSGVLRTWQRRWFDLKGDRMYYYFDDQYVKPPYGAICLPGNHVVEHTFKANDPERFVFEIVPDRNVLPNQEPVTLAAESEEERTEWMRVIKEILYGSIGGAIFGKSLEEILRFESSSNSERKVPIIVEACVEYISEYGHCEEGIFRMTGRSSVIKSYCDAYDRGERPSMKGDTEMDVHSASSILKLYLRELPSPLIPFNCYEDVIRLVTRGIPDDVKCAMESLRKIVANIATPHYDLLQYLCSFLCSVGHMHIFNKMTFSNLATIFSTAFIRPDIEKDPCLLMATSNSRKALTHVLIEHQEWLFSNDTRPFEGAIELEQVLGLSGVEMKGSPENGSASQSPSGCSSEEKPLVMRKKTVVNRKNSDQNLREDNRKWLVSIRNEEDLENLFHNWNTNQTVSNDVMDTMKGRDDVLVENKSNEFKGRTSDSMHLSSTLTAFPSTESADKTTEPADINRVPKEIYHGLSSLNVKDKVHDLESLTSFIENNINMLSKDSLKKIINILLKQLHRQEMIILKLTS